MVGPWRRDDDAIADAIVAISRRPRSSRCRRFARGRDARRALPGKQLKDLVLAQPDRDLPSATASTAGIRPNVARRKALMNVEGIGKRSTEIDV